jgi:hypothetical protein
LPVSARNAYQPTLDMVRAAWGPRTKGLVLGSPSNPTGTLVPRTELKRIAAFIAEHGGVLIADEIYQGLVYGEPPSSALGLPGEVVLVNSFSKYFCMTGWRLGWVVLPEGAVRGFEKLAQHLFISAPAAAQHAAVSAFSPESLSILEERRRQFAARRDFLVPQLKKAGLSVPAEPHGAFYVYAGCGGDARRFARDLLEKEAVAATPGIDSAPTAPTASCASPTREAWKISKKLLDGLRGLLARALPDGLEPGALGVHLAGVLGGRLVEGAGIHLQAAPVANRRGTRAGSAPTRIFLRLQQPLPPCGSGFPVASGLRIRPRHGAARSGCSATRCSCGEDQQQVEENGPTRRRATDSPAASSAADAAIAPPPAAPG